MDSKDSTVLILHTLVLGTKFSHILEKGESMRFILNLI